MDPKLTGEELQSLFRDIDSCMAVLQGDLHQPGTPAVVLKLESLWNKLKMASQCDGDNSVAMVEDEKSGGIGVGCRSEIQSEHVVSTTQSSPMEGALYYGETLGLRSTSDTHSEYAVASCYNPRNEEEKEMGNYIAALPVPSRDHILPEAQVAVNHEGSAGDASQQVQSADCGVVDGSEKAAAPPGSEVVEKSFGTAEALPGGEQPCLSESLGAENKLTVNSSPPNSSEFKGGRKTDPSKGSVASASEPWQPSTQDTTPNLDSYTQHSFESKTQTSRSPEHIEALGDVVQANSGESDGKLDGCLAEEGKRLSPTDGERNEASAYTDGESSSGMGEEYQKVEFAVLYWHKSSGYYYDPQSQLFYAPAYCQDQQQSSEKTELQTQQKLVLDSSEQQQPESEWSQLSPSAESALREQYTVSRAPTVGSGQTSIAETLAAASDRVMEKCGYLYNEGLDMFYDSHSGLYYHQESKLYYDPDLACYLQYDHEKKKYSVHSRLKLPPSREKSKEVVEISSDEEESSEEEGEIRLPRYPRSSPPPEEEFCPCIRSYISDSRTLSVGTVFLITREGAVIGREPSGSNTLIRIPELKVSKIHARISYNKYKGSYAITDEGSVNGTFLKDQRLSPSKEGSQPYPLVHNDTVSIGSCTFVLHIHPGYETCYFCDPAQREGLQLQQAAESSKDTKPPEELDITRKRVLNRLRKRHGLSMKDTYGEEIKLGEGYKDRSQERRKILGSDAPQSERPVTMSTVHRPIEDSNKGRQILERMGWKKGQGIGKEEGRLEPVQIEVRDSKLGLGLNFGSVGSKTQKILKRFHDVSAEQKEPRKKFRT